jgi:hypothetical protein
METLTLTSLPRAVALIANHLPAWRATRIDPMEVLQLWRNISGDARYPAPRGAGSGMVKACLLRSMTSG